MNIEKKFLALRWLLVATAFAFADSSDSVTVNTPYNPATGIWIQQVGDLYPSASTTETVYYTRYSSQLSAKSLDYYYDGNGYLKLSNKKLLCRTPGADGIVHHPDGDLLVAGQGNNQVYKVNMNASDTLTSACVTKSVSSGVGSSTYHLMVNPDNSVLWSAGIPGNLVSYAVDSATAGRLEKIRQVKVHGSVTNITTIIWDQTGQAYYTRSSNLGTISRSSSNNAQFGMIVDTTCAISADPCPAKYITALKTKTLIDSLKGAHGASFDEYSNTILLFGDSHIVQIDPTTRKVVADVDLRKYMFPDSLMTGNYSANSAETNGYAIKNSSEIRWLLDQGTADHKGHIFVASNSGHLVFLDYTSNPNKLINNNILIHVQWIDNYLDDLAPIAGAGSNRTSANTNGGTVLSSNSHSSSSAAIYRESSSSVQSSSSKNNSSSSSVGSGSNSSSSSVQKSSSSGTGAGDNPNSSSSGTGTGNDPNSSSSGTGSGNDSGSSSSRSGSGDDDVPGGSSSSVSGGGDDWIPPWVNDSTTYAGLEDEDAETESGADVYPTNDKSDKGDTLVTGGSKLIPVSSESSSGLNTVEINGNTYVTDSTASSTPLPSFGSDASSATGREAVNVGDVIQITLDADKIKDYFGDADSIFVSGSEGLVFVDPSNPSDPSANIAVPVTGSDISIWVSADTVVSVGSIYFTDKDGHLIIFDGINFYDAIPKAETGYIQDSDDDGYLDSLEVILADTIPSAISVTGLAIVVNGDTLDVTSAITVSGSRIYASAEGLSLETDKFPEDARVIITYTSESGTSYRRDTGLLQLGSHVIKQAYAIRNKSGKDSLFIEFNIDIIPADLNSPEMIVWLNGMGFDLDEVKVYLPTKNMIILVGDSLGLNGSTDYVTLAPAATFHNLSFIATTEYERQVPVTVTDRYPSATSVQYYDTDGDGALDSISVQFSSKVSAEDLQNYYFSFPWYSSRGLLIELQALPRDLILSSDGMSVGWVVKSNVNVASNLTSISSDIPAATLYTYYNIFDNSFVTSQTISIEDKMAPVIASATLHYGEDSKRDTLTVTFSEEVDYSSLSGKDFFAYIHGKDTIDLNPVQMIWSSDGKSVRLVLRESTDGIVPGDSLMIVAGKKSKISDIYGNESVENASPVVIGGLLGKIVESVNMGFFDPEKYVENTLNSVSISYVSNQTRTSDLRDEGTLGHLISLGERFVPQLVDGAKLDADGNYDPSVLDSINPADVFVNFSVSYFDNLGQYVTDTTFNIPCNSAAFGTDQNCLTTDKKVFVNWNYKDHTGRLVGAGVYIVQFKLVVRYKQKKIQEEMRDKWGVRRKKKK
ncbi:MAG: hypothetical protein J6Z31_06680 [Fibrobacter sp.]|nr:hypothetical protein [Fibrobacter sp.]